MKIYPEKLAARLDQTLDKVYLVAGQEPLLIEESCDRIRAAARAAGVTERLVLEADARFDWQQIFSATETGSLFASTRLVEIRLPTGKPGRQGGAALRDWIKQDGDDILLVKCDDWALASERTAWAKALDKAGVYVPCWKIRPARLPAWISQRLAARGLRVDSQTGNFLVRRLEGNLLAADKEIERLAILYSGTQPRLEDVRAAVADSARFDSFRLVELVLARQPGPALRCIRGLLEADTAPPLVVGALARELQAVGGFQVLSKTMPARQAFSKLGVWPGRQQALAEAARTFSPSIVRQALARLSQLDEQSKSSSSDDFWVGLERLCVGLAAGRPEYLAA